jgi:hypothetical protein
MGNHDARTAYARELFGEESEAPQDRVYDVAGLRIISLDTSVPGWHHGEVSDEQLARLRDGTSSATSGAPATLSATETVARSPPRDQPRPERCASHPFRHRNCGQVTARAADARPSGSAAR